MLTLYVNELGKVFLIGLHTTNPNTLQSKKFLFNAREGRITDRLYSNFRVADVEIKRLARIISSAVKSGQIGVAEIEDRPATPRLINENTRWRIEPSKASEQFIAGLKTSSITPNVLETKEEFLKRAGTIRLVKKTQIGGIEQKMPYEPRKK